MKSKGLWSMIRNRKNRERIYGTCDYWDAKAVEYKGDALSMWPNHHLNKLYHSEQIVMLNRTLINIQRKDILDVGCGTGRISYPLANQGAKGDRD